MCLFMERYRFNKTIIYTCKNILYSCVHITIWNQRPIFTGLCMWYIVIHRYLISYLCYFTFQKHSYFHQVPLYSLFPKSWTWLFLFEWTNPVFNIHHNLSLTLDIRPKVSMYVMHTMFYAMEDNGKHIYVRWNSRPKIPHWMQICSYSLYIDKNALNRLSSLCDWCLWSIKHGWILLRLVASSILAMTTRLPQAHHQLGTPRRYA